MINDIKLGLSMIKYGLNVRGAIFGVVFGIGAALLFILLFPVGMFSGLLIGIVVGVGVQLIYSLSVSTMIQSSPYKKRLRTTVPTWIAVISMLIANTLYLLMEGLAYLKNTTNPFVEVIYESGERETGIVFIAGLLVFSLLYTVIGIRFFWISLVLLFGALSWFRMAAEGMFTFNLDISMEAAILLSYVIVLLGCGIMYVFNCLTYKYEYSELSFRGLLKRESS